MLLSSARPAPEAVVTAEVGVTLRERQMDLAIELVRGTEGVWRVTDWSLD